MNNTSWLKLAGLGCIGCGLFGQTAAFAVSPNAWDRWLLQAACWFVGGALYAAAPAWQEAAVRVDARKVLALIAVSASLVSLTLTMPG